MIELTEEQRRELEQSEPVVVDPVTKEEYVLVRREAYERLKEAYYDDSPWTAEEMLALAWQAGKHAGWEDPKMDEYDRYEEYRR